MVISILIPLPKRFTVPRPPVRGEAQLHLLDQQDLRGLPDQPVQHLTCQDQQVQQDLRVLPALPVLTEPQVLLVLPDRRDQRDLVDHPVQRVLMEQRVQQDLLVLPDPQVHQVLPVLLVWSFLLLLQ